MPLRVAARNGATVLLSVLALSLLLVAACNTDQEPQSATDTQQAVSEPPSATTPATSESAQQEATAAPADDSRSQGQDAAAPQQAQQAEPEPQAEPDPAPEEQTGQQTQEQAQITDDASTQADAPAQQQASDQAAEQAVIGAVPEGTRIVTLFGDLTEIIYALGAQEYLVGRDTSSVYPAQTDVLPNLGFAGALNVEAILALEPTIVIGNSMAGPPGVLDQLEAAGVELLIIETPTGLDAPGIKIRAIGEALGLPETAETLAQDIEARMAAVQAQAQTIEQPLRVLLVYIRRGGLQLVSGQGNEAQTIIEAAGGIDAGAEAGIVGWQALTPEALVAANPDVYLVMELGLEVIGGIDEFLAIPGMAETTAGRERRIIAMSDLYLLGFGPRLPEAVAELSAYLQALQEE